MKHIAPKPTLYNGVTFHSKLEARWAVLFDNYHRVESWKFEAFGYLLRTRNWRYTPDFYVVMKNGVKLLFEMKPVPPTQEYLNNICLFQSQIDLPLILAVGNFWDQEVKLSTVFPKSFDVSKVFNPPAHVLELAAGFRFDLSPPKRKRRWKRRF